jgi:ribonuclease HII
MRRTGVAAARRPLARGARRLRRDLIASGTATLEAALFKCPMVITYAMHALSWQMMKRMNYQPWVGLPNILLREFAVPECCRRSDTSETGCGNARMARQSAAQRCSASPVRGTAPRAALATRQRLLPMRSRRFLRAEQLGLVFDTPGLGRRGRRSRPRAARRAGGGCGVILDELKPDPRLKDSKVLTALKRERLYDEIRAKALCCSVAEASVDEIDELNILQATLIAMKRAVEGLRLRPAKVLVDGNQLPRLRIHAEAVIGGGTRRSSRSRPHRSWRRCIATGLCLQLHELHPQYGFDEHKGYSTPQAPRGAEAPRRLPDPPPLFRSGARGAGNRAELMGHGAAVKSVTSRDNPLLVRLRKLVADPAGLPQARRNLDRRRAPGRCLPAARRRAGEGACHRGGLAGAGAAQARPARGLGHGRRRRP